MNQPAPQKTIDNWRALVERLQTEADLCRNEGAEDIAALMDEAVNGLQGLAAEVQALRADRAGVLLSVIQALNQNPYSLTKSECIDVVQSMRAEAIDAARGIKGAT